MLLITFPNVLETSVILHECKQFCSFSGRIILFHSKSQKKLLFHTKNLVSVNQNCRHPSLRKRIEHRRGLHQLIQTP